MVGIGGRQLVVSMPSYELFAEFNEKNGDDDDVTDENVTAFFDGRYGTPTQKIIHAQDVLVEP